MSYLSDQIGDAENLTNFVLESNKFRNDKSADGRSRVVLHFKALMPDNAGERSVFRMDGLSQDVIAELGRVFVAQPRDKKILGWGKINAATVRQREPLRVRADEPPPRHAVIDRWPVEVEHTRALAMELAQAAEATRLP